MFTLMNEPILSYDGRTTRLRLRQLSFVYSMCAVIQVTTLATTLNCRRGRVDSRLLFCGMNVVKNIGIWINSTKRIFYKAVEIFFFFSSFFSSNYLFHRITPKQEDQLLSSSQVTKSEVKFDTFPVSKTPESRVNIENQRPYHVPLHDLPDAVTSAYR